MQTMRCEGIVVSNGSGDGVEFNACCVDVGATFENAGYCRMKVSVQHYDAVLASAGTNIYIVHSLGCWRSFHKFL